MKKVQSIGNEKRLDLINDKENIHEQDLNNTYKTSILIKTSNMDIESVEKYKNEGEEYLYEIVIYLSRMR
jgi:hypothetical protein